MATNFDGRPMSHTASVLARKNHRGKPTAGLSKKFGLASVNLSDDGSFFGFLVDLLSRKRCLYALGLEEANLRAQDCLLAAMSAGSTSKTM